MGQIKGLILKAADRPELERWARARNLPYRQVLRARMLRALAEGQAVAVVATAVGVVEATVATWRDRYLAGGLSGLRDQPRQGCPPTYQEADRVAMWQKLQEPPPAGHTRWSLSLMAQATGLARSQLQRWWSATQIQPQRTRTFKRSQDPEFEAKLRDVVDLYPKKEAR